MADEVRREIAWLFTYGLGNLDLTPLMSSASRFVVDDPIGASGMIPKTVFDLKD